MPMAIRISSFSEKAKAQIRDPEPRHTLLAAGRRYPAQTQAIYAEDAAAHAGRPGIARGAAARAGRARVLLPPAPRAGRDVPRHDRLRVGPAARVWRMRAARGRQLGRLPAAVPSMRGCATTAPGRATAGACSAGMAPLRLHGLPRVLQHLTAVCSSLGRSAYKTQAGLLAPQQPALAQLVWHGSPSRAHAVEVGRWLGQYTRGTCGAREVGMVSRRLWGAGLPARESQPALPPPGPASDPGSQVRYALSPMPALVAGACSWTPLG